MNLQEAITTALNHSDIIKSKRSGLKSAKYLRNTYRSGFLPEVTASWSQFRLRDIDFSRSTGGNDVFFRPNDTTEIDFIAQWNLSFYKTIPDYIQQKYAYLKEENQFYIDQQDFILEVISVYFEVLTAEETLHQKEAEEEYQRKTVALLTQKKRNGALAKINSLNIANAELSVAESELQEARANLDVARKKYEYYTGVKNAELSSTFDGIESATPSNLENFISLALKSNKDLLAVKLGMKELKAQIASLIGSALPDVSVKLVQSDRRVDNPDIPSFTQTYATINAELKIFGGGKSTNAYIAAVAAKKELSYLLAWIEKTITIESERLWRQNLSLSNNINGLRKLVNAYENEVEISEVEAKFSKLSEIDVLKAKIDLHKSRLILLNARFSQIKNIFLINFISGLDNRKLWIQY